MLITCCLNCIHLDYEDFIEGDSREGNYRFAVCNLNNRKDICLIDQTDNKTIQLNGKFEVPQKCPYVLEHTLHPNTKFDYESIKKHPMLF